MKQNTIDRNRVAAEKKNIEERKNTEWRTFRHIIVCGEKYVTQRERKCSNENRQFFR